MLEGGDCVEEVNTSNVSTDADLCEFGWLW